MEICPHRKDDKCGAPYRVNNISLTDQAAVDIPHTENTETCSHKDFIPQCPNWQLSKIVTDQITKTINGDPMELSNIAMKLLRKRSHS